MAANKPIEIIIKDERGEEAVQGGGGSNTNIQPDSMPNQQAKENKKASALQAAAMMVAMRSISYASSNIGKWTGNSRNQILCFVSSLFLDKQVQRRFRVLRIPPLYRSYK